MRIYQVRVRRSGGPEVAVRSTDEFMLEQFRVDLRRGVAGSPDDDAQPLQVRDYRFRFWAFSPDQVESFSEVEVCPDREWPFEDAPPETRIRVMSGPELSRDVFAVRHMEPGEWAFYVGPARYRDRWRDQLRMGHLVGGIPSLAEVADLPVGWIARRDRVDSAWIREPCG